LQSLKTLILLGKDSLVEKQNVKLRGMTKILVSEKKLEESIKEAKKSVFRVSF